MELHPNSPAQVIIPSEDLNIDIDFFKVQGFRLEQIFPADDPAVAIMSGHSIQIRIDKNSIAHAPTILLRLNKSDFIAKEQKELISPGGSRILFQEQKDQVEIPEILHTFEVRKLQDGAPWVIGRAGMLYRDLIPNRLGGSIIASHIRIPQGGPVPDMVHYHTIGFQLIFCYKGWVKLVYEDQGPPFILRAGDCVTQPPEIRHRVLESSDQLEVIEIGVPAEHLTTIDHEMTLPTGRFLPEREFQGQTFCHHKLEDAEWIASQVTGFEYRDTGIFQATKALASVQVLRAKKEIPQSTTLSHKAGIFFSFIMNGSASLCAENQEVKKLQAGDAFVIPPHWKYQLMDIDENLELLEVQLFDLG